MSTLFIWFSTVNWDLASNTVKLSLCTRRFHGSNMELCLPFAWRWSESYLLPLCIDVRLFEQLIFILCLLDRSPTAYRWRWLQCWGLKDQRNIYLTVYRFFQRLAGLCLRQFCMSWCFSNILSQENKETHTL